MKVKIIKTYNDTELHRLVKVDESFDVKAARGKKLIAAGVAVEVEKDVEA